jgi:hypothetical protein
MLKVVVFSSGLNTMLISNQKMFSPAMLNRFFDVYDTSEESF